MPEVAHAGEDHGEAGFVCGGYHLIIADRSAGLNDAGGPSLHGGKEPVGKGEEGVRGDGRPPGQGLRITFSLGGIFGLAGGDAGGIDPAHLAVADAGATAVIQPGGSIRDDEVIEAADEAGLAMVFTGMRHFRH